MDEYAALHGDGRYCLHAHGLLWGLGRRRAMGRAWLRMVVGVLLGRGRMICVTILYGRVVSLLDMYLG